MRKRVKLRNRARREVLRLPATPEITRFGARSKQNIDDPYGSFEEASAAILGSFRGEDRSRLRGFIGAVLERT